MDGFGRTLRRATLLAALSGLATGLGTQSSHAAIDAVDIAVEAVAGAGQFGVGVRLGETEKAFIKGFVRCAADGGNAGDCAKNAVLAVVFKDAGPLAGCVIGGGRADKCAIDAAVNALPPQAQPLAGCIAGGNVAGCARSLLAGQLKNVNLPPDVKQFAECLAGSGNAEKCATDQAIKQLPSEAQPVANCIAQGKNVSDCGKQATSDAQAQAFAALQAMQTDVAGATGYGTIHNILQIVRGIREGNWGLVIVGGAPEAAKLVIQAVLNVLLTPALAKLAGPIVNVTVDNDTKFARDVFGALKGPDPAGDIGEIIFEFWLTTYIAAPCALVPSTEAFEDLKEVTCGNLGKAIQALGSLAHDGWDIAVGVAEDVLKFVGLYEPAKAVLGAAVELSCDFWSIWPWCHDEAPPPPPPVCDAPGAFYAGNYMKCLSRGANAGAAAPLVGLNKACHGQFDKCGHGDAICRQMAAAFEGQVGQINNALNQGAVAFTASAEVFMEQAGVRACDTDIVEQFVSQCMRDLSTIIPLSGSPNDDFLRCAIWDIRNLPRPPGCMPQGGAAKSCGLEGR